MEIPLLTTKFNIPFPHQGIIPRPQLLKHLDAGREGGITLVSAPAGYGKTTLVSSWLNTIPTPAAWFSIDEGDNDLFRFLTYFATALQSRFPDTGESILIGVQSLQPPPTEHLLTTLLNEISDLQTNFILILDDYHFIDSQPVHDALNFIIDHMPPHMHMVITGRIDPPLHLSRLRVNGLLNEIRAAELRFKLDEATTFLDQMSGLKISQADIQALEDRTEGWIAGLQLAAISMRGHENISGFVQAFKGSHRFVIDYLVEEVLSQQSDSTRDFLLKTSILERMNAALCNAVVDRQDSQEVLEQLEKDNLFVVPLDLERNWYRYHHLFAEFLHQRLNEKQDSEVSDLHLRASRWHQQNDFITNALRHALAANDFQLAVNLIEINGMKRIMEGEVKTVYQWLNDIPNEHLESNPLLSIYQAWVLFLSGQLIAAEHSLQNAELVIRSRISLSQDQPAAVPDKEMLAEVLTIRSFVVRNQPGGSQHGIELAKQALQDLPSDNQNLLGLANMSIGTCYRDIDEMELSISAYSSAVDLCLNAGNYLAAINSIFQLSRMYAMQGQLHQAELICRKGLLESKQRSARGLRRIPAEGMLHVGIGTILYEWNEIESAEHSLREGIRLGELSGFWDTALMGRIFLSRVQQSKGNHQEALTVNEIALNSARESDSPIAYRTTAANRARLWITQGNLADAEPWAREIELDPSDEISYLHEFEQITLARYYLAADQPDAASKILQQLLTSVEVSDRRGTVIQILGVQSLVLNDLGKFDQAVELLERALSFAHPEGYRRAFLDLGPELALILHGVIAEDGLMKSYAQELLSVSTEAAQSQTISKTPALVEPLSERELEVLTLMNQGLSGPEIADQLFVSVNTVKTHIKNIYGKLGVNKRFDAIDRAQKLDLLKD
jgi:LuxR family maltose regulon positive regulatory protein